MPSMCRRWPTKAPRPRVVSGGRRTPAIPTAAVRLPIAGRWRRARRGPAPALAQRHAAAAAFDHRRNSARSPSAGSASRRPRAFKPVDQTGFCMPSMRRWRGLTFDGHGTPPWGEMDRRLACSMPQVRAVRVLDRAQEPSRSQYASATRNAPSLFRLSPSLPLKAPRPAAPRL